MLVELLTSSSAMAALGAASGFAFRQVAENAKRLHEERMARHVAGQVSADAAAVRSSAGGGTMMRRLIYALLAVMFAALIAAGFVGVPVVLEADVTRGILFWRRQVTEYHTVTGYFFPPELRTSLLALVGFYCGQGVR